MPFTLEKLTPNLIVSDVQQSLAFYCGVLGFTRTHAVPDEPPFVFAGVKSGAVEIFLNAPGPAVEEYPALAGKPIGGTLTLFIHVSGIERIYGELAPLVTVTMPLEKKWYGVTEFAFEDPDGYVITFAELTQ
jgi:catechol 2,3-dioxygenase-like lactoylglutathione lyase family enzyme